MVACGGGRSENPNFVGAPNGSSVRPEQPPPSPSGGTPRNENPGTVDPEPEPTGPTAPPLRSRVRYPNDRSLSPLTPTVLHRLQQVSGSTDERVFAKVGASTTVSTSFMHCFDQPGVDLAGDAALQQTLEWFQQGSITAGTTTTPFSRQSLAATVGWSAGAALAGDPSPLAQELDATRARYAFIQFGTNDVNLGNIEAYTRNMTALLDRSLARGVIPIVNSVMPRDDDADANVLIPRYNAVAKALSQARMVPFIDLHRELLPLPDHGIGPDGVHMTTYRPSGPARACAFTEAGLRYGYNLRNWLSLRMLSALRAGLSGDAAEPDGPELVGEGSFASPTVITALPFAEMSSTEGAPDRRIATYPGCAATQDEGGPERYYRLELAEATTVRLMAISQTGVDVDIHLVGDAQDGESCLARHNQTFIAHLSAGVHQIVVDTFRSGGVERSGDFVFVAVAE